MNDTERNIFEGWVAARERLERSMREAAMRDAKRAELVAAAEREAYERARQRRAEQEAYEEAQRAEKRAIAHKEAERQRAAAEKAQWLAAKRAEEYIAEQERRREQENERQYRELLARKSEEAEALARADTIYDSGARVLDEPDARIYQANYAWAAEKRTQENQIRLAAAYCDRLFGREVPFSEMETLCVDGLYDYILGRGDKQRRWREWRAAGLNSLQEA